MICRSLLACISIFLLTIFRPHIICKKTLGKQWQFVKSTLKGDFIDYTLIMLILTFLAYGSNSVFTTFQKSLLIRCFSWTNRRLSIVSISYMISNTNVCLAYWYRKKPMHIINLTRINQNKALQPCVVHGLFIKNTCI